MRKKAMPAEKKFVDLSIETIEADGRFAGYASLFGQVDLGKDAVEPGAFAKSLRERGASGIRMLWQHDPNEPIGTWIDIREDSRGLYVEGKLTKGVARAREVLELMRSGAIDGLSIGFRTVRARPGKAGVRYIQEADLWEISVVTFPMLPAARVGQVKAAMPIPGRSGEDPASTRQLRLLWNIKANEVLLAALKFATPSAGNRRRAEELTQQNANLKASSMLYEPFQLWRKYRSDQARVPAGNPDGGQWTDEGGGGTIYPRTRKPGDQSDYSAYKGDQPGRVGNRRRDRDSSLMMALQEPYLIETDHMGPSTLCTYQGWRDNNRFTMTFPRGDCPKTYNPFMD